MKTETTASLNYRDFLKLKIHHFYNKKESHENSIIKFTNIIDIPDAIFMNILSGNQPLDKELAFQIAFALELDTKEIKYLITLINYNEAKSLDEKEYYLQQLEEIQQDLKQTTIYGEDFKEISDWFHLTILELTRIENFELTALNISYYLDISSEQAEKALNRLLELELLVKQDGKYKKSNTMILTSTDMPSFYIRKHHHQMIQKARFALEEQNIHERDITSLTIAIDDNDVTEIKKLYASFKKNLTDFLSKSEKKNSVFQFNFQVFNLTNNILKGDSNENNGI